MLRGSQKASALCRKAVVAGFKERGPRSVFQTATAARCSLVASPRARSRSAFDSAAGPGLARRMFAAAPGSSDVSKDKPKPKKAEEGFFSKIMGKESCVAAPDFTNRWAMVAPAFLVHMCIGSHFAWEVISDTITRELGFVSSAAGDWSIDEAHNHLMDIATAVSAGSTMRSFDWARKVGPRLSMSVASLCFGGGMALSGLGIEHHSLPLLYTGYGVLVGTGVVLAYTTSIVALLLWFPHKNQLACTGLIITGGCSGICAFVILFQTLMEKFPKMPTYLGTTDQVATVVNEGKLFAETASGLVEVVSVSTAELARLPYDLAEGVYVVGTGSTGAAATLYVSGALYGGVMLASAMAIKTPAPGYIPRRVTGPYKDTRFRDW